MRDQKINRKQLRFLEEYAKTRDHAEAYLAAGYKSKTKESARTSGSRLLHRLDGNMDYREVLDSAGLTDRRLAEVLKTLVEHKDPKIQVQAVNTATKVKGWQHDVLDLGGGQEIIIVMRNRKPDEPQPGNAHDDQDQDRKLVEARKPVTITD